MDINEIIKRRNELNLEIFNAISPLLDNFRKETGISINDVVFNFEQVTTYQDKTRQYVLINVRTELSI